MNKTFAEFLDNNPEFWGNYGYPEAVKSIINDWFYYRECCVNNETKFARMFGRKLNILEGQFNAAYEKYLELADIDPEKIEAFERTIERVKNNEISKIIERAIEESVANTRTLNTNTARTGTETTANDTTTTNALQDLRTLATSHTKTGTEEVDTTNTGTQGTSGTANQTTYTSDYPQSSPTLAFNDYVSQGAKTDNTNSTTRTDNLAGTNDTTFNVTDADTGTITDASTGTVTVDNDVTLTHNTNTADTGTIADAGTKSNTNNENGTETEAGTETETEEYTRKGAVVEMFEKYFRLVKSSNVIQRLLDALDVCFIQLYEEDEDETSDSGTSGEIEELQQRVNQLIAAVEELETSKQDVLTAGDNITIENNVISATGGGGGGVSGDYRKFSTYSQAAAYMGNTPGKAAYTTVDDRTPTPLPASDTTGDLIEVTILNSHQISVEAQVMGTIYVAISGGTYANLFPENNPKLQAFYDAIVNGGGNEYYDVTAYNSDPEQQEKEWLSPDTEVNPDYTDFTFEIQTDAFGMNNVLWCVDNNGDIKPLRTVM